MPMAVLRRSGLSKVNHTQPSGPLKIYKLRIFEYFQNKNSWRTLIGMLNRRMTFEF